MRKIELKVGVVTLNERDYKRLLRRFDVSAARLVKSADRYKIDRKCICASDRCEWPCPFLPIGSFGCIFLLRELGIEPVKAELYYHSIEWLATNNTKARAEIKAIRDALLTLERV